MTSDYLRANHLIHLLCKSLYGCFSLLMALAHFIVSGPVDLWIDLRKKRKLKKKILKLLAAWIEDLLRKDLKAIE